MLPLTTWALQVLPLTVFTPLLTLAADTGPGATAPVRPFRLDQVRLSPGLLTEKRDRTKSFIRAYDERRFLVLFNNVAGRPNPSGLTPPGGWEDGGLLSGHWAGHYLSALSQAYAEQGETAYKSKLDWMVDELAACQAAYTATKKPTHAGYLGALPEDTVLRQGPPRFAGYGGDLNTNTWAPWYTQHKIVRGLLDAYYNANNTKALQVAVKMADWAYLALTIGDKNQPAYKGNVTRDDLNLMWDTYIAGEFGGANEVFAEIYGLTNDARHLQTARAFDNRESLFGAAVANKDILVVRPENKPGRRRAERLHANTHIPQFLGYVRIFEQSRSADHWTAAKNFFEWVVPHRELSRGGTGGNYPGANDNPELFQNRDNIANALVGNGAETCTTYNTLKLARNLFLHEHNAAYMDHYERGLFNMIAGSRKDTTTNADPQLTYFQPLAPGTPREYGNTGTCCGGTGMESHTKYQETIYLREADGSAVWVNLYIPSTLTWTDRRFSMKQETTFPRGDTSTFTVLTATSTDPLDVKLRVPGWIRKSGDGFQVSVNGVAQSTTTAQPSSYFSLKRTWKAGDVVVVRMPFSIRIERARDRPDTQSLLWGPVVLQTVGKPAGTGTNSPFWSLSLYRYLTLAGDYGLAAIKQTSKTSAGDPLFTLTSNSSSGVTTLQVRPYYISDSQPVSTYFRRYEPTIVFRDYDTGVPNRKRNDGLPNYDVPVAGIPTAPGKGTDGLSFLDVVWDQAPFASLDVFTGAVGRVVDEFVRLGLLSAAEGEVVRKGAGRMV